MKPEHILPHLPNLRRYARLVMGEQAAGDAMVEAMLKRLLSRKDNPPSKAPPRTVLYKSLVAAMSEHRREPEKQLVGAGGVEGRLGAIKPPAREVFLLVTVEEFSLAEAADVMGMTPTEVARNLEIAGNEIARQIATTVLIIEDEPLIAMTLESIVTDMGHRVMGIAATKAEALSLIKSKKPGLILADIQLADGSSGQEAVLENSQTSDRAPAIFITAFPERVLTGTKPEPTFIITKPFEAEQVKAVVSQTLFFQR
jgi:DNA-directed RNA polymerase specialized sigma24 family protein